MTTVRYLIGHRAHAHDMRMIAKRLLRTYLTANGVICVVQFCAESDANPVFHQVERAHIVLAIDPLPFAELMRRFQDRVDLPPVRVVKPYGYITNLRPIRLLRRMERTGNERVSEARCA